MFRFATGTEIADMVNADKRYCVLPESWTERFFVIPPGRLLDAVSVALVTLETNGECEYK